ncbi:DUF3047 domain-containing protein [Thiovibrio sp. JS02]
MQNPPCRLLPLFALCLASAATVVHGSTRERILDNYENGISAEWQSKSFAGQTYYTAEKTARQTSIKASSQAAASGLFYRIDYDPREKPLLKWSWKIEHTIGKGDARTKAGDDYAARVYVVFPSFFFWNTRALNYIWANKLRVGMAVPNAFTANAMMIAVESGDSKAGQWVSEERNIYEDFKRCFGGEPPRVGAIAIMTDTDNTGDSVTAWYGPIIIAQPGQ